MGKRSIILLVTVLVCVSAGAAGVYAFDHTGRGTIAKGVTVAGIDVGGLDASEAHTVLERKYVAALRAPIIVQSGGEAFTLTADDTKAAARVSLLVDQALALGRDESILARTWRRVKGSDLNAQVAPSTIYDRKAADGLVDRITEAVDRSPKDASVKFDETGLQAQPGIEGLTVQRSELLAALDRAIVDPRAERTISVPVTRSSPSITTDQLAGKFKTALFVNRKKFTLTVYRNFERVKIYHVAVGAVGLETPEGLYHIQNKAINPAWTKPYSSWVKPAERGDVVPGGIPQNPLKARWMGIFDGAGIHGIDPSEYGSIGHAASHGCVRMRIPDVIDLYKRVDVGTPIYIA